MSFREVSAWVMGAVMAVSAAFYLHLTWEIGGLRTPALAVIAPYVILLIVASIVAQVTLAAMAPREADAPPDERERPLLDKAGNWSGFVLGTGVVGAMLYFLHHGDANLLFHMLMGSMIVSQFAEYAFQVWLLRAGR